MILGNLHQPARSHIFLNSPILKESLRWITENAGTAAEGIHELGETGWRVIVQSYITKHQDLCIWENHLQTIDLQFIVEGVEGIDVTAVEALGKPTVFKPESDTQKFAQMDLASTRLVLRADDFVLLLPGEAHRPQIAIQEPAKLKKLVVKVPAQLITKDHP